jgi:hypothetical protein
MDHMANPLLLRGRTSQVGGYYSITTAVRDRRPLLARGNNASLLRDELQRVTREGIADTLAWVVMPDHLHWLFQLRQGSLGALHATLQIALGPGDQPGHGLIGASLAGWLLRSLPEK